MHFVKKSSNLQVTISVARAVYVSTDGSRGRGWYDEDPCLETDADPDLANGADIDPGNCLWNVDMDPESDAYPDPEHDGDPDPVTDTDPFLITDFSDFSNMSWQRKIKNL